MKGLIGDSVELPKWLAEKKSAKSKFFCLVEGPLVSTEIRVLNVWNISMHCVLCC